MTLIQIPFRDDFSEYMILGRKNCTTRNKKYGERGDHFSKFGTLFELMFVVYISLDDVAKYFYFNEGFDNAQDFIKCWNQIHPDKVYNPRHMAFLHFFKKI